MGMGVSALYNGNISETIWRTANSETYGNRKRGYAYQYDALNRITEGGFRRANSTGSSFIEQTNEYNVTGIDYDLNGNIKHLNRRGVINSSNSIGDMDKLTYTYSSNSNKLQIVSDAGNDTYGFKDDLIGAGIDSTTDYTYDVNGNMTKDDNKGITRITYNHLNLPTKVTLNNGNIEYFYDATGVKLKKIVSTGENTLYAGNYIYSGSEGMETLKFFNQPEGYVEPENASNYGAGFNYIYQYKDHLGNIRLSYSDKNGNGTILVSTNPNTNELVEENNYYPFGLKHKGYNYVQGAMRDHKYGFGGKEEQDELGLGWIDITARNYDPALGRWMNIDPLAEISRRFSPYTYALNNPIFFIDPDGMTALTNDWKKNGDGTYTAEKGDSAGSLHTQHLKEDGYTYQETNHIVETQRGENKVGSDGQEKSNIKEGDVVVVPDEYVAAMEKKTEKAEIAEWNKGVTNELKSEIAENHTEMNKIDKSMDSLDAIYDNAIEGISGKHDGLGDRNGGYILFQAGEGIKASNKKVELKNKKDSLREVNQDKSKEIKRRDSLFGYK
ncbi:hypothetical protein EC396_14325 [Lutibacter sp. HS1-25]|nr:hypothetical protein EC396_14325 [Lutibacter sp. HS1-25]